VSRYGEKADIWSIGVITYIMLSGSFPFDEDNLFDQVINEHFEASAIVYLIVFSTNIQIEAGQYSLAGAEWSSVSNLAKHFIRSLMTMDIDQRCDIQGAIEHDWIQSFLKTRPELKLLSEPLKRSEGCGPKEYRQDIATYAEGVRNDNIEPDGARDGEPCFSNIFWSDKASIVKLASMKSRVVSMKSDVVPGELARSNCNSTVAKRISIKATQDLIRKKSAMEPLIIESAVMPKEPNTSSVSGRSKKRQHIESRVLSDDEIDEEFSDEDVLPPLATETIVAGKKKRRSAASNKVAKTAASSGAVGSRLSVVSPSLSSSAVLPTDPNPALSTSGAAFVTPEVPLRPALQKVGTIDKYFSKSSPRPLVVPPPSSSSSVSAAISAAGVAVTPRLPTKTITDVFDASHKRIL
jgi:serine/threonine protein kinase